MNKSNYKIASVVILYNPDENVFSNVNTCSEQTDFVYVIDNSETINDELIKKILGIKNIDYKSFNENKGVAYALNYAAELAIKNNFDFLLTMDQDSYLTQGTVKGLTDMIGEVDNVGIISPLHRNKFKTQETHNTDYDEVLSVKTSGNLLNLKIFEKAGKFIDEFFIDYVDIEYGMRLNLMGYKILRLNNVILEHCEANLSQRKILGIKTYPWNHQPIRWYYKIRNLLYLEDKYSKYYPDFFRKEKFHYIKQFIKVFLYESQKLKKLKFGYKGYKAYKKKLTGIGKFV